MTLGIYIQVPFCQTKCTYCNFHTGVFARGLYAPYVDAVCRELAGHAVFYAAAGIALPKQTAAADAAAPRQSNFPVTTGDGDGESPLVDTIYVGGGTPSLLDASALSRILETVKASFPCALEEVTLEADPETVTFDKADAWLRAGFNRISLGAQSFNNSELKTAGRMHRREDIFSADEALRWAGFRNLSFDLIAGLPCQTKVSWDDSLNALVSLRPEHVSVYLLEVDEESRLGRQVLSGGSRYGASALPSEDDMASFYERACERLAAEGYQHYEISNWALPRFRSRHNLKYWQRQPYLGFGAGAHSFNGTDRWANVHDPVAYVAAIEQGGLPIEQHERLSSQQALQEELFLGLRQLDGIDLARIERQYDAPLAAHFTKLKTAGLVEIDGARVRLAPSRLTVSNEVFVELMDTVVQPSETRSAILD